MKSYTLTITVRVLAPPEHIWQKRYPTEEELRARAIRAIEVGLSRDGLIAEGSSE